MIQVAFAMAQFPFAKKVKAMPKAFGKPSEKTAISENKPKTNTAWVVISDRDDNFTTTTAGGSLFMKKLGFMEPFFVAEEKNGFLKLIKYKPELLNGRKLKDKKSAESFGWISRWKMLMWNKSYVSKTTGYPEKSIAVINGSLPLTSSKFYYDRTDSAFVYSSPALKKVIAKVRLHQINYIYKKSEDGRKYLIGNDNQLVADSAKKVIYGWIAADAVHNWGERLFISPKDLSSDSQIDSASQILHQEHADPLLSDNDIILKSSPVISNTTAGNVMGKATDVYNKSNNTLIAIDGSLLKYPDYLNLRKHIHNVNIVFVIDASSAMKKYLPGLTNTIQSLENVFAETDKKNKLSYGAVVYRDDNNCIAQGIESTDTIHPDYSKVMNFLGTQVEKTKQCNDKVSAAPLYNGVRKALDMLQSHENENNLVILIGSVGDYTTNFKQLSERFGQENARLLTIQMYSEFNPWYNNFVLNAKKLVSESAVYSAESKKRFLINGEGLNDKQSYNVSQQDSISFYLDYPKNSLIQGGVVFPTKGEVNSKKNMVIATRRFLKETDLDINNQITSLDSAFRLRGISNTNLSETVKSKLPIQLEDDSTGKMPHNAFKYYMTSTVPLDVVAKNKGLLQYTLVLNEMEFKQLNDIIALMVGQNLEKDKSSFRKQLVNNYLNIPRNMFDLRSSNGSLRSMTLANYFKLVTGLPIQNKLLDHYTVNDLKSDGQMPKVDFEKYIQFLINSAGKINIGTQVGQQFISNGKTYYYITTANFTANPEN
jgi:hypothetical protein